MGGVTRGMRAAARGDGRSGPGGWEILREGMGGAAREHGRGSARECVERRRGVGTVARGDGRGGAGGCVGRREGMRGAARRDAWGGAEVWAEHRRGMGAVARGMGGMARGDAWSGAGGCVERCKGMRGAARGMGELRGNEGGSNEKDAVLKGRTRRLQTLNSVWKGNYCSGIGDGGAIKSTKQREASAVPYRFVMVIPSVMKLSSPK